MLGFPLTALAAAWQSPLDEAGRVEREILR
jgi:hypothetical protein